MKTTASNRKIRVLLTALKEERLIPRPDFQRRLVWNNKDKSAFLETVLINYPFPEIYIAAGEVNVETGEGMEMLVDGQQRITTLNQYFTGSPDLRLRDDLPPYKELIESDKLAFLEYDVVVRDLGKMPLEEIRNVFEKINATSYSLNAMEIHNARFQGDLKTFADEVARYPFFDKHHVFGAADIRRMNDMRFIIGFIATIMSTYFNRDDEIEQYLEKYNDEFEQKQQIEREIKKVLSFIDDCNFDGNCRVWKKADFFTLLVEVHRVLEKDKLTLDSTLVAQKLNNFYTSVDNYGPEKEANKMVTQYSKAALQATNDRGNRIKRGYIIQELLNETIST